MLVRFIPAAISLCALKGADRTSTYVIKSAKAVKQSLTLLLSSINKILHFIKFCFCLGAACIVTLIERVYYALFPKNRTEPAQGIIVKDPVNELAKTLGLTLYPEESELDAYSCMLLRKTVENSVSTNQQQLLSAVPDFSNFPEDAV